MGSKDELQGPVSSPNLCVDVYVHLPCKKIYSFHQIHKGVCDPMNTFELLLSSLDDDQLKANRLRGKKPIIFPSKPIQSVYFLETKHFAAGSNTYCRGPFKSF